MVWRAATSSPNSFVVPTTILRCLRLPSGPGSRHLNSQTSGPPCRSVRIMLPFCMDFPFCASNADNCLQDLQAQFRHRLSMRKGKKRNKSRKVIAFLQRCPNCGERGSMREKGIDGRHAEADSLGLGNQSGTTSFVNSSAFPDTNWRTTTNNLQIPLSRQHWISPEHNLSIPRCLRPGLIRG